jgi:hypothetical protein
METQNEIKITEEYVFRETLTEEPPKWPRIHPLNSRYPLTRLNSHIKTKGLGQQFGLLAMSEHTEITPRRLSTKGNVQYAVFDTMLYQQHGGHRSPWSGSLLYTSLRTHLSMCRYWLLSETLTLSTPILVFQWRLLSVTITLIPSQLHSVGLLPLRNTFMVALSNPEKEQLEGPEL